MRAVPMILLAAVLLGGCGAQPDETAAGTVTFAADYPEYGSATDLVKAADVIVRGVAVTSRVEEMKPDVSTAGDPLSNPQAGLSEEEANDASPVVVTVSTVRVTEVIKGNVRPGDEIEVSQLGGVFKGVRWVEGDTVMLSPAEKSGYVLLLASHGAGRPYDLPNPEQAMYQAAADGRLTSVGGRSVGLETLAQLKAEASRG